MKIIPIVLAGLSAFIRLYSLGCRALADYHSTTVGPLFQILSPNTNVGEDVNPAAEFIAGNGKFVRLPDYMRLVPSDSMQVAKRLMLEAEKIRHEDRLVEIDGDLEQIPEEDT